ncbi:hypothetical protein PRUPE_8G023400 [Prunus persica]|uniref:Uncharacterized protein n=1 Tax=Prunus persica TaxID=3760 RepID=A0A251MUG2_PRUPE|nr:hypothetical protein PRUPE_8G023400 [Prunus persica]
MNWEKLMKMAGAVHTGGKGSMRRVARYSSQYIISHLGPDNLDNLMKLAEQFQKQAPGASAAGGTTLQEDDDDEVPELVAGENFEAAAEEKQAS